MKRSGVMWSLALAAIAASAVSCLTAARHLSAERAALNSARGAGRRYALALRDHDRLLAGQPTAEEVSRLSRARALGKALRARMLELESQPTIPGGAAETVSLGIRQWGDVGNATPRAAITSVLWAASQGEVARLASLIGFSANERSKASELFSQLPVASQRDYGTPEMVVATMISGNFPKDASSMAIRADREWGEDASVVMSVDHASSGPRTNLYHFKLSPQGWRLVVPANVMDGIDESLLAEAAQTPPSAH